MNQVKVARNYAKGLFLYANELNKHKELYSYMCFLNNLEEQQVKKIKLFLYDFSIDKEKKSQLSKVIFKNFPSTFFKFIDFLISKKREPFLFSIAFHYKEIYHEYKDIIEVTITSADFLKEDLKDQLKEKVKKLYKANEYILSYTLNPSIIGGFIIKIKDKEWNFSLKERIKRLKEELIDTSYIRKY